MAGIRFAADSRRELQSAAHANSLMGPDASGENRTGESGDPLAISIACAVVRGMARTRAAIAKIAKRFNAAAIVT